LIRAKTEDETASGGTPILACNCTLSTRMMTLRWLPENGAGTANKDTSYIIDFFNKKITQMHLFSGEQISGAQPQDGKRCKCPTKGEGAESWGASSATACTTGILTIFFVHAVFSLVGHRYLLSINL
jgi:hypothetical protein